MNKKCLFFLIIVINLSNVFSETSPLISKIESLKTAQDSITYLQEELGKESVFNKGDISSLLAQIQEQQGLFNEAGTNYSIAASYLGIQSKEGQLMQLGAIRCALSTGDTATADLLLSTSMGNPTDAAVTSRIRLYAVWSAICKAETTKDLEIPIHALEQYTKMQSMKLEMPSVLLTLWHITKKTEWATQLQNEYPNSPEASVTRKTVSPLPSPFWYFIPE